MPTAMAIIKAVQWVASTGGSISVSAAARSAYFRAQGRNARRARFVPEKAINAFSHEAFLPTPGAGLRLARPAHNPVGSDVVCTKEDDSCPPHMFLGGTAIPDHSFKSKALGRTDCEGNSSAHAPDSQIRTPLGSPNRTLPLGGDH